MMLDMGAAVLTRNASSALRMSLTSTPCAPAAAAAASIACAPSDSPVRGSASRSCTGASSSSLLSAPPSSGTGLRPLRPRGPSLRMFAKPAVSLLLLLVLPGLPSPAEGGRTSCDCASAAPGGVRPAERRPEAGRAPKDTCCGLLTLTGLQTERANSNRKQRQECAEHYVMYAAAATVPSTPMKHPSWRHHISAHPEAVPAIELPMDPEKQRVIVTYSTCCDHPTSPTARRGQCWRRLFG